MTQHDKERSMLWPAATVGGLGAGVAAGMKGNWKDLLSAAATQRASHFASIEKLVSEAPKFAEPTYAFDRDLFKAVQGLETSPAMQDTLKRDIASSAYEAVMSGKKVVGHTDAHGIFDTIRSAPTVDKAYDIAQKEISNLGGDPNLFAHRMGTTVFREGIYKPAEHTTAGIFKASDFAFRKADLTIPRTQLTPQAAGAAEQIESQIKEIFKGRDVGYLQPEFRQAGPQEMMRIRVGTGDRPAMLDFPLLKDVKETYVGKGTGTRYITQDVWSVGRAGKIETKTFNQFMLDTLQAKTSQAEGVAGMKKAVRDTIQVTQEKAMKWVPSRAFVTEGSAAREAFMASQAIYQGTHLPPGALEAALTGADPMLPIGSAKQVAAGALATQDWRRAFLGPMHELMPYERVPLQPLRDWTLTDIAKTEQAGTLTRAGAAGEFRSRFAPTLADEQFTKFVGEHAAPKLDAIYLKTGHEKFMADEMGIMSRRAAALQQWERTTMQKFRLADEFPLHKDVLRHMKETGIEMGREVVLDKPVQLTTGDEIGIDVRTNRLRTADRTPGLRRDILGYEVLSQDEIKLHLRETKHVGQGQAAKFFGLGSATKHTITAGDPADFMGEVYGTSRAVIDPDIVMPGDRISRAKNPYALMSQQVEAMEFFTERRVDTVRNKIAAAQVSGNFANAEKLQRSLGEMESFLRDPTTFLDVGEGLRTRPGIRTVDQLSLLAQNRIITGAGRLGLMSNRYMPEIFGLMDPVDVDAMTAVAEELSEATINTQTSSRLKTAIEKSKFVRGRPQMFMGDLFTDMGAGQKARWGPSMFHWLAKSGAETTDVGARMAIDLERRIPTATRAGIEEMTRMQQTLLGKGDDLISRAARGFADAEDFTTIPRGQMIRPQGYWADLGQDVPGMSRRIYIAGRDAVPELGPVRVPSSGEVLASEIENSLYDFQSTLMDRSENADRKIREASKNLQTANHATWARTVSIRDRAAGTLYAPVQRLSHVDQVTTADVFPTTDMMEMSEEMAESLSGRTARITRRTAVSRFKDMLEAAPDEATRSFLDRQQEALLAGKRVPGIIGRYPGVGPYSVQPTFFQVIEELNTPGLRGTRPMDDVIYVPEAHDDLKIMRRGKEIASRRIPVGPAVGMKMDYDLDFGNISFFADKETAGRTAKHLVSGDMGKQYSQYLTRHQMIDQLFKEKQPQAITDAVVRGEQERLVGAGRHAVGQATVGRTNIALEQYRRALALSSTALQDKYEPLLWHMEETATIMAKHGGASASQKMADLYSRSVAATKQGNVRAGAGFMTEALAELGGAEEVTMRGSLRQAGVSADLHWSPQRMGRELAETLHQHQHEVSPAIRVTQALKKSHVNQSHAEMLQDLAVHQSRTRTDAAQVLATSRALGPPGIAGTAGQIGTNVRSRAAAISSVLGRAKVPIGLGAAAAAGIMLMSPGVSGTVPANPNIEGVAGGRNLRPEESIPANDGGITPPASGMMVSPSVYRQTGNSTRLNMTNTSKDFAGDTYEDAMKQLQSMRGVNMRTRLNVSDNRASLDSNMLADKIYRRM